MKTQNLHPFLKNDSLRKFVKHNFAQEKYSNTGRNVYSVFLPVGRVVSANTLTKFTFKIMRVPGSSSNVIQQFSINQHSTAKTFPEER